MTHYTSEQIDALLADITPGEWQMLPLRSHAHNAFWGIRAVSGSVFFGQGECNKSDAAFIAAAPAIVTQQAERIKALEAALQFYAKRTSWEHAYGGIHGARAIQDKGDVARQALGGDA